MFKTGFAGSLSGILYKTYKNLLEIQIKMVYNKGAITNIYLPRSDLNEVSIDRKKNGNFGCSPGKS